MHVCLPSLPAEDSLVREQSESESGKVRVGEGQGAGRVAKGQDGGGICLCV